MRGKAVREAQAKEKDKWPSCSMRYTQDEGEALGGTSNLLRRLAMHWASQQTHAIGNAGAAVACASMDPRANVLL